MSKGLDAFVTEDKSLNVKMSYDEFIKTTNGIDDSAIEEAYNTYLSIVETGRIDNRV